ncbi:MAG: hypothetical protein IH859_03180 [Chloroflexi bacterium]|nr:hypothetical protein [Chloroflexota bacterium]
MQVITIHNRFHGPPGTGNGGYVSGLLANFIDGAAEVRLYKPPPLDQALTVHQENESVSLFLGHTLIAAARLTALEIEVPQPPTLLQAQAASQKYVGFTHHYFPTCFVCGPNRVDGDGLHIFAGQVAGQDMVAAPWTPDDDLAGPDGFVLPEYIWAALDCPGAFAFGRDSNPMVLGTIAAEIFAPLVPGEECIVTGWPRRSEGRKYFSGTAVYTAHSDLIAQARATWIELESLEQFG